jgi:wyosine [tRNA(Phe)-imidazoG37] synthetase (radical SAM superfamily)
MGNYKYLFGPVPSRRFGRSLGVDLTPYKTCTLDCVFCQLGRTTEKTVIRQEYVPMDEVISELEEWLKTDGKADYITLSGSGEPTLHSRFGDVLQFIRKNSQIPALLLTNGTMLNLPEVRAAASFADIVKVSLSAWDQSSYRWVNRPHPQLHFDSLLEGQKAFRGQFTGEVWMEVFLVAGMNSMPDDVSKISNLAKQIGPHRIQLNTAVRPPAEDFAAPLSREQMEELPQLFQPRAEVIADFKAKHSERVEANQETIFSMLQRRPCTAAQIADVFDMHLNEVSKYIGMLMKNDKIDMEIKNSTVYYEAKNKKVTARVQRSYVQGSRLTDS